MNARDRRLAPVYALVLSFALAWGIGALLYGPAITTIRFGDREVDCDGDSTPRPGLAGRPVELHPVDCTNHREH